MTNKDYKRLTIWNEELQRPCMSADSSNEQTVDIVARHIDRLYELENAIENGTLMFLPCKVGDTVYYIDTLEEKVQKGKITAIEYWTNGNKEVVAVGCKGTRSLYFGKTVFKTKVVADRTLEELKETWRKNERTDKEQRKS